LSIEPLREETTISERRSAMKRLSDYDALAPETFDSPYPVYERLRAERPVAWSNDFNGFWSFTKHADVAWAATDYKLFVNSVQHVVPKVAFTGRRPPLHLDPPEHTPYRAALLEPAAERAEGGQARTPHPRLLRPAAGSPDRPGPGRSV
jgi:cytochrome P450